MTFNLYSQLRRRTAARRCSPTPRRELSGSTATATSAGYTATATGTDYWVATFNGDSNNTAVTSGATAEPVDHADHAGDQHQPEPASATVGKSIATRPRSPAWSAPAAATR